MREILFRGKDVDSGKWVCGNKIFASEKYGQIMEFEVIPETVGQYTGLTDKNGKKIFEGDIMRLCEGTYPCLVYWDGKGWAWKQNGKRRDIDLTREKMSIIGNIHDNPELLRGEK